MLFRFADMRDNVSTSPKVASCRPSGAVYESADPLTVMSAGHYRFKTKTKQQQQQIFTNVRW